MCHKLHFQPVARGLPEQTNLWTLKSTDYGILYYTMVVNFVKVMMMMMHAGPTDRATPEYLGLQFAECWDNSLKGEMIRMRAHLINVVCRISAWEMAHATAPNAKGCIF